MKKQFFLIIFILTISFPPNAASQEKDLYENDDNPFFASTYSQNQDHSFHNPDDIDWIMFYGENERSYSITVHSEYNTNIIMVLYDSDTKTKIQTFSPSQTILWKSDSTQQYYLKLSCQLCSETVLYSIMINNDMHTDMFEPDNSFNESKNIIINETSVQHHCFHDYNDAVKGDWTKFHGLPSHLYEIKIKNVGSECDPIINIYDGNRGSPIITVNYWKKKGLGEQKSFNVEEPGIYYIQITSMADILDYEKTYYDLSLKYSIGEFTCQIAGEVYDSCNGRPLKDVKITIFNDKNESVYSALNESNGLYNVNETTCTGEISFNKSYSLKRIPFGPIDPLYFLELKIPLSIVYDLDRDEKNGLSDIIMGLQILSGATIHSYDTIQISLNEILCMLATFSK